MFFSTREHAHAHGLRRHGGRAHAARVCHRPRAPALRGLRVRVTSTRGWRRARPRRPRRPVRGFSNTGGKRRVRGSAHRRAAADWMRLQPPAGLWTRSTRRRCPPSRCCGTTASAPRWSPTPMERPVDPVGSRARLSAGVRAGFERGRLEKPDPGIFRIARARRSHARRGDPPSAICIRRRAGRTIGRHRRHPADPAGEWGARDCVAARALEACRCDRARLEEISRA